MSSLQLFDTRGPVTELEARPAALERSLQNLIEANMETFFGVTFLQSEYVITNGRIDSIGIDENNCPVIFEYKRSVNENVINQGLFYLDWLLDHKANFKLLVLEKQGKEKANNIDWSVPCVICIANDFTRYDLHAVNQMQRNIRLVKYKLYDGLLLFEHLNAPNVAAAAPDLPEKSPEPKGRKEPKAYRGFRQYFALAGEEHQKLYASVRDYILSLGDDITENQLKYYVAFKKVKNFACVEVYQTGVTLHLRLDPDTVELKKDLIQDVRNKGHWGTGELEIKLHSAEEFEAIKHLIDRAYNEG